MGSLSTYLSSVLELSTHVQGDKRPHVWRAGPSALQLREGRLLFGMLDSGGIGRLPPP